MWYVKSFTGSLCLLISLSCLLYVTIFLYDTDDLYVLPLIALVCLLNVTLRSPGCISTRAECIKEPTEKQSLLMEKYAPIRRGGILQPPHAHYSHVLNAVVLDYDHFCFWANNGIGLLNLRYFIQFLFWTFCTCVYCLCYILTYLYNCTRGHRMSCTWLYWHDHETIVIVVGSFLFGMFSLAILVGQLRNLTSGLNNVDNAKGVENGRYGSFYRFFGSYTPIGWFLPTPNTDVLYEHGKKSVSKCAAVLEDADIKIIYK